MPDERIGPNREADSELPAARRKPGGPPTKDGFGYAPLTLAVVGLGAVTIAWVALDRTVSRLPSVTHHHAPDLPTNQLTVPPPEPEQIARANEDNSTAPALSRFAREQADTVPAPPAKPHPMPAQLAAASRIAEARRVEREREEAVRPGTVTNAASRRQPTRLAPPGRAVQLAVYEDAQDARAAARGFRYRYRGLLANLPSAVLPYRPPGARQNVYRVQFVVPNQAYAEITCQRLRAAQKACIVIY